MAGQLGNLVNNQRTAISGAAARSSVAARNVSLRISQERRRNDIALDGEIVGAEYFVDGRAQLQGAGQSTISLAFPITFIKPPTFTFGYELAAGYVLGTAQFPIVSCGVAAWGSNGEGPVSPAVTDTSGPRVFSKWYTGAIVACLVIGDSTENIWVHWQFKGVGLTNPLTNAVPVADNVGGDV